MGKLSELKIKNKYKKEGRLKEYQDYKEQEELGYQDISMRTKWLSNAIQRFSSIQEQFPEDSKEYIEAKYEVDRWKHALEESRLILKFFRPNSQQDIEYRKMQIDNFASKLKEVCSPNLDLRFHGTPIYFAEQIIKSGTISSTADRCDGYIKSTDMKGEISASSIDTVDRTIKYFSDMSLYQRSLPAGCIFALLPKDKDDATYGHDLMHSVDFNKNPEQLFGVFTTPENIDQVKGWMNGSGLNNNLVYTFEEFIQVVKEKSDILDKLQNDTDNSEIENDKSDYLFSDRDAKEVAMTTRTGRLAELQRKIKDIIKGKFRTNNLDVRGENADDGQSRY